MALLLASALPCACQANKPIGTSSADSTNQRASFAGATSEPSASDAVHTQETPRVSPTSSAVAPGPPSEVAIRRIPLAGPASWRFSELSGLAWSGDNLLLMPQYPDRFPRPGAHDASASNDGSLFAIPRAELLAVIDGTRTRPITPGRVEVVAPGLEDKIPGMQGFEAIAVAGAQVFATVEANPDPGMAGWLLTGQLDADLSSVRFATDRMVEIRPSVPVSNAAEESLLIVGDRVLTFFEANGANINPRPVAHVFSKSLEPLGTIPFPAIEYRVIDASAADASGRFWVSNYFYPGDRDDYQPAPDPLVAKYGQGRSHRSSEAVERLLMLAYKDTDEHPRIELVERPPIQLQLAKEGRNWEGLVQLDDRGFIVATDMFPETILAFVPTPAR